MIKKLLRLEVLVIALSLIFVSFACSDDDDDSDKVEFLEGKVNYGGSYKNTNENSDALSLSFEKGNKVIVNMKILANLESERGMKVLPVFKIASLEPTGNANEYKMTIHDLVAFSITLTKEELVTEANTNGAIKDWQLNVAKEISIDQFKELAEDDDLLDLEDPGTAVVSISEDKNTITFEGETFTYQQ